MINKTFRKAVGARNHPPAERFRIIYNGPFMRDHKTGPTRQTMASQARSVAGMGRKRDHRRTDRTVQFLSGTTTPKTGKQDKGLQVSSCAHVTRSSLSTEEGGVPQGLMSIERFAMAMHAKDGLPLRPFIFALDSMRPAPYSQ